MVFASDQNGNDANFVHFSRNADLLIMHMAVPEQIRGAGRALHAPPSLIGQIAGDAGVRRLVLSHFMARSLRSLDEDIEQVTGRFDGDLFLASDLDCFVVD